MHTVQTRSVVRNVASNRWFDFREWIVRTLRLMSGSLRPALLNRSRKGENPYDFSRPENQHTYLAINHQQWR